MIKNEFIMIPRNIVISIGFNAAGLLAELSNKYNYNELSSNINEYGEFSYKIADCENDNGLTRKEQATAIKKLIEVGFIEYTISRGMPKLRYFKLTEDSLKNIFNY